MRGLWSLLPCTALLVSCASYSPGDDPRGLQLQTVGVQVLQAARNYMDQNARPPHTLQDLVPKFLPSIPAEPAITYDLRAGRFEFIYKQDGAAGAQVACHAVLGETDWSCTGIYAQKQ